MRVSWRSLGILSTFLLPVNGLGKDYILTLGGGYEPAGNQASLEANVLFFQELVRDKHPSPAEHRIYFADGFDEKEDLQILATPTPSKSPAMELLASVFSTREDRYDYRDHQVKDIRGALSPSTVRVALGEIAEQLVDGDRLIVYVTAHGSASKSSDPHNTSILCWNKRSISMKSFSGWLDEVPAAVPVVMIMAQCYCGGFANAIYLEGDWRNEIAPGLRVGFFAQRHDLPAAGCRPDVENDEEYSSYFWGAFMGRSRTGKPVEQFDCDGDGRVSFAEAHAYAVVASPTIDIPLKISEAFLRKCSRISRYDDPEAILKDTSEQTNSNDDDLLPLEGRVEEIVLLAMPDQRQIVTGLMKQLELPLSADVTDVFLQSELQRNIFRQSRRSQGRRGRFSVRRELRNEILEKWPELVEMEDWPNLEWLKVDKCESFLDQVRLLPSYKAFEKSQSERRLAAEKATKAELRDVLFRRLIYALESIIYSQNLPYVGSPEEIQRYRDMLAIEQTSLER